jgi:hypothetical protein
MAISQERAKVHHARQRIERLTADARSYGGRRTRIVKDPAAHAARLELEQRLLELARQAVRKYR